MQGRGIHVLQHRHLRRARARLLPFQQALHVQRVLHAVDLARLVHRDVPRRVARHVPPLPAQPRHEPLVQLLAQRRRLPHEIPAHLPEDRRDARVVHEVLDVVRVDVGGREVGHELLGLHPGQEVLLGDLGEFGVCICRALVSLDQRDKGGEHFLVHLHEPVGHVRDAGPELPPSAIRRVVEEVVRELPVQAGVPHGHRALHDLLDARDAEALELELVARGVVRHRAEPHVVGYHQVDVPEVVVGALGRVSLPRALALVREGLAQLRLEAHEVQRDPRENNEEGLQSRARLEVHCIAGDTGVHQRDQRAVHVVRDEARESFKVEQSVFVFLGGIWNHY